MVKEIAVEEKYCSRNLQFQLSLLQYYGVTVDPLASTRQMPHLTGNLLTIRRHREGKYLGGNMRYLAVLLALLAMVGCGNPVNNKGGDPRTVSVFVLPPSIAQLSPATTPVNSVPFLMTVNGTNFGTAAIVFWNGTPLHTVFMTPNQLVASITAQELLFTGLVRVYVLNGGLTSNTVDFNITAQ